MARMLSVEVIKEETASVTVKPIKEEAKKEEPESNEVDKVLTIIVNPDKLA